MQTLPTGQAEVQTGHPRKGTGGRPRGRQQRPEGMQTRPPGTRDTLTPAPPTKGTGNRPREGRRGQRRAHPPRGSSSANADKRPPLTTSRIGHPQARGRPQRERPGDPKGGHPCISRGESQGIAPEPEGCPGHARSAASRFCGSPHRGVSTRGRATATPRDQPHQPPWGARQHSSHCTPALTSPPRHLCARERPLRLPVRAKLHPATLSHPGPHEDLSRGLPSAATGGAGQERVLRRPTGIASHASQGHLTPPGKPPPSTRLPPSGSQQWPHARGGTQGMHL